MFGNKLKIEADLYEKLSRCAAAGGYSSAEEFAVHVLEKETARILDSGGMDSASEEELRKRLEGLGYIE